MGIWGVGASGCNGACEYRKTCLRAIGRPGNPWLEKEGTIVAVGRGARLGFDRVVFTIVEVTLGRWWSRVRFIEDAFRAEDGCG